MRSRSFVVDLLVTGRGIRKAPDRAWKVEDREDPTLFKVSIFVKKVPRKLRPLVAGPFDSIATTIAGGHALRFRGVELKDYVSRVK